MERKIEVEYVLLKDIKPNEYNPKQMTKKEEEDLERSIVEFGIVDPLIVNKAKGREGVIIGGHQRYKIYQKLGFREVPVVKLNIPDLRKEQELCLRLSKNTGSWNWDLLVNFDEDLLMEVGWKSEELDKIFQLETSEDEFDVDAEFQKIEEPKTKYGDLYKLGNHKVLCGDATKKEDVEKLMGGEKADMVFTDPPYGINLDTDYSKISENWKGQPSFTRGRKYDRIIGDDEDFNPEFLLNFFDYCKEIFLWGAENYSVPKGGWFVWDKTQGKTQATVGSEFELCWSKQKHKREIILSKWAGAMGLPSQDIKKRLHPAQKPIEICKWFIERFSKRNEIVVDLFGGSGSTLIACEQLNRRCFMMEIDPKYCDVIVQRWEKLTGKKANLLLRQD